MARYVLIKAGKVINVMDWDGVTAWTPPPDCTASPHATASIGWNWNNGSPVDPSPPPPTLPPPSDLSEIDNLDKTFRAIGLVLRDYTNALQAGTYTQKSVAQLKSDFKAKYISLP